jgi:hypothetical protein
VRREYDPCSARFSVQLEEGESRAKAQHCNPLDFDVDRRTYSRWGKAGLMRQSENPDCLASQIRQGKAKGSKLSLTLIILYATPNSTGMKCDMRTSRLRLTRVPRRSEKYRLKQESGKLF